MSFNYSNSDFKQRLRDSPHPVDMTDFVDEVELFINSCEPDDTAHIETQVEEMYYCVKKVKLCSEKKETDALKRMEEICEGHGWSSLYEKL